MEQIHGVGVGVGVQSMSARTRPPDDTEELLGPVENQRPLA